MSNVLEEYIPDEQLAAELDKSPRTLARWRRLREGPPVTKIGKKIFYRRSAVKEWLASLEVGI